MAKEIIAADYDNVKATLSKMNNDINEIVAAIKELQATINNTEDWKGVDATAYKSVLQTYARKINNSTNWLETLDKIIDNHAHMLYRRALAYQKIQSFR